MLVNKQLWDYNIVLDMLFIYYGYTYHIYQNIRLIIKHLRSTCFTLFVGGDFIPIIDLIHFFYFLFFDCWMENMYLYALIFWVWHQLQMVSILFNNTVDKSSNVKNEITKSEQWNCGMKRKKNWCRLNQMRFE